ncbi:MAG TPA: RNA polymerase sigma factor [Pirellulales bacterium]|nr:RNA polymerase sigma factor [Pirellulales bacterium]
MAHSTPHSERLTHWVHEHARSVRGYLLAMVRDGHAADDLLQEVFCRAWQARDRYAEQGAARAYLLRIADRLVCDRGRTAQRERPMTAEQWEQFEPATTDGAALATVLGAESRQQLIEALDTLSDAQKRTLLLRYYGDLEFQEIARIMECPTNTVLSHARRGLLALRRLLVEEYE